MDLPSIVAIILNFVSKWVGTTIPKIAAAFFGLLCVFTAVVALWDRRIKNYLAIGGILFGLFLITAAYDPRIIHFFANSSYFVRVRIVMVALSFIVIMITIESIRRSHLQERYAILWIATSLIILITAFFPNILNLFQIVLGTDYVTSVIGIVFTFLLLIAFHFSISLSTYRKNQTRIAQRCALIEEKIENLIRQMKLESTDSNNSVLMNIPNIDPLLSIQPVEPAFQVPRKLRGSQIAIPIVIACMVVAIITIGILTPHPMIGDEVTHYYMLSRQAEYLSKPNFYADIPVEWGSFEHRRYPHPFLWHYLGALVFRISGKHFYSVQIYQAFFWAQLLFFAHLLSKLRQGIQSRSALAYILVLASLPVGIIFSIAFYQDVPMTAQVLASFYFLRCRRWFISALFMCLAIGFKITALLFIPAYLILMVFWEIQSRGWLRGTLNSLFAGLILFAFTTMMGQLIRVYAESTFYPEVKIRELIERFIDPEIQKNISQQPRKIEDQNPKTPLAKSTPKPVTPYEVEIIANHPGDLRVFENYFVYGGVLIWMVILMGSLSLVILILRKNHKRYEWGSYVWLLGVGFSYTLFSAYFLQTAPDARFFLPGLPFLILPFVELVVKLPKPKIIIAVIASLAVLQSGYVMAKTYKLRNVSAETRSAIAYLKSNPPSPKTVFMYPEGNYRLFPVRPEWYMNYKLREFWKADNDVRIRMLNHHGIGAVVIKKHLIGEVDEDIINLGVYPSFFVKDLRNDSRFENVFENDGILIFRVPLK